MAIDAKSLTIDSKSLLKAASTAPPDEKVSASAILSSMTPTQYAQMFPQQRKQALEREAAANGQVTGRAVSGGVPGTTESNPGPVGGGGGARSAVSRSREGSGGSTRDKPQQSSTDRQNSFFDHIMSIGRQPGIKPEQSKPKTGGDTLVNIRASLIKQLEDPKVRAAVLARAEIEVGAQPKDQQLFLESLFNRAAAEKLSLYDAVSNDPDKHRYYPKKDDAKWKKMAENYDATNNSLGGKFGEHLSAVGAGSNIAQYATDNSSGDTAKDKEKLYPNGFRGPGGEFFNTNKQRASWAARIKKADKEAATATATGGAATATATATGGAATATDAADGGQQQVENPYAQPSSQMRREGGYITAQSDGNWNQCASLSKAFNPNIGSASTWKVRSDLAILPGTTVASKGYGRGRTPGGKSGGKGYHTGIAITAPDKNGNFLILDQYAGSGGARVRSINVNSGLFRAGGIGVVENAKPSLRALEIARETTKDESHLKQIASSISALQSSAQIPSNISPSKIASATGLPLSKVISKPTDYDSWNENIRKEIEGLSPSQQQEFFKKAEELRAQGFNPNQIYQEYVDSGQNPANASEATATAITNAPPGEMPTITDTDLQGSDVKAEPYSRVVTNISGYTPGSPRPKAAGPGVVQNTTEELNILKRGIDNRGPSLGYHAAVASSYYNKNTGEKIDETSFQKLHKKDQDNYAEKAEVHQLRNPSKRVSSMIGIDPKTGKRWNADTYAVVRVGKMSPEKIRAYEEHLAEKYAKGEIPEQAIRNIYGDGALRPKERGKLEKSTGGEGVSDATNINKGRIFERAAIIKKQLEQATSQALPPPTAATQAAAPASSPQAPPTAPTQAAALASSPQAPPTAVPQTTAPRPQTAALTPAPATHTPMNNDPAGSYDLPNEEPKDTPKLATGGKFHAGEPLVVADKRTGKVRAQVNENETLNLKNDQATVTPNHKTNPDELVEKTAAKSDKIVAESEQRNSDVTPPPAQASMTPGSVSSGPNWQQITQGSANPYQWRSFERAVAQSNFKELGDHYSENNSTIKA